MLHLAFMLRADHILQENIVPLIDMLQSSVPSSL